MTPQNPACFLMAIGLLANVQGALAAEPVKDIVVFDFEMMDSSAGAGLVARDDRDQRYLAESTQVAKDHLL